MELIIVLAIVGIIVVYLVMQRRKDSVTSTTDGVTESSKEQPTNSNVILITEEKVVPSYEADNGPLTTKQIEQIKEVAPTPIAESAPYEVPPPPATTPLPLVVQEDDVKKPAVREKKSRKPRVSKVVLSVVSDEPVKKPRKSRSKKA